MFLFSCGEGAKGCVSSAKYKIGGGLVAPKSNDQQKSLMDKALELGGKMTDGVDKKIEGHFILGKTNPNAKILVGKKEVKVSKDGTVTAGNASGINDGAAAVVLMSKEEAKKKRNKAFSRN